MCHVTHTSCVQHNIGFDNISLNLVPNAQVCVDLIVHITKLQLQITFPKPLYITHFACIHQDLGH
jgi:hypothetical protein